MSKTIKRRMASGVAWMVAFRFVEKSFGLISTIILARLLAPEDFGLMAMAVSIIAILELTSAFSFDMALIQNQNAERRHYDTAWTFNVIFSSTVAVLLLVLAKPGALFYSEPRLEMVMYCLALGSFFFGWENIGTVAFRKDLEFAREFKYLLGKKLVGFSITVPLAIILQNYWALVIGNVGGRLGLIIISYLVHPYRPRLSLAAAGELFHFSKWLLINNILYFFKERSADFIIGKLSGAQSLGRFSIAFEISNMPITQLVGPINRAVYPGYSKMAHDLEILRDGYISVVGLIAMFAVPAGLGIAAVAEPIVKVFLGSQWLEAIPLIQVLAIFGAVTALRMNIGSVFLALGTPRHTTLLDVLYLLILIPLVIFMTNANGAAGAAEAYLITALIAFPVTHWVLFSKTGMSLSRYVAAIWRPVIASIAMYFTVSCYLAVIPPGDNLVWSVFRLTTSVSLGAILYFLLVYSFWLLAGQPAGFERLGLDKLMAVLKRNSSITGSSDENR
jgi:O-antigen/teichoic acid export membrane protein